MNLEKLKDAARKFEQKEDWRRAIEVYQKAIVEFESGQDPNPDLSIYNRVGDLYMKANDPAAAVQAYERAVDLYSDQGFLNNAIALCGKILRVNPGRIQAYLKLAQLHARKNVVHDAKKNLIEYLERMNQVHQLEEAFKAVKAFADQFPGNQDIRLMLSDLLRASSRTTEAREQLEKLTVDLEAKGDAIGARRTRERLQAINEEDEAPIARQRKNDLVFLDIGVEVKAPAKPATPPAPPRRSTVRVARPTVRTTPVISPEVISPEVMIDDSIVSAIPPAPVPSQPEAEEAAPLEIETSSLADDDLDLASLSAKEAMADLLRADDAVVLPEAMPDLEPTIFEAGDDANLVESMDGLVIDTEPSLDLEQATSILDDHAGLDADVAPLEGVESSDALVVESSDALVVESSDALVVESSDALVVEESSGEIIEGAELDDGTDWDIPEELEPVAVAEETVVEALPPVVDGTPEASLAFLQVEEPVQPTIEELEDRILDDPDNPESHRALGEALLAAGDPVRGIDELDLALLGYENREDWEHALDLIRELIQVDPTSVRYYQKRVEVAYRTGDKDRLIVAYLELGDALVRTGALDKALAVYRRVAEHEPDNERAQSALLTLAPPEEPAPKAAAPAARATPAPAATPANDGDFIDLGMLVREEAGAAKDTRMRVEDEEPTGDEERDFKDMLSQFKRGIEANLDSEDFQSHYDLGVAYKEMGLLDEAIAEFQKALRSPDNRLRTSEALGVCFYEKNQPAIAEAILRRAVDSQAGGDDQKIGLLYWLGRAFEAQAKVEEALATYRRVMAVDIQFGDLADRVSTLNAGRVG